jgi:hypothetical protein
MNSTKLIRFAYNSTGLEVFYQTLFGTKSIKLSVRPLGSKNRNKLSLPRSFVREFGSRVSSDRFGLKSKVVERFKRYRMVYISLNTDVKVWA